MTKDLMREHKHTLEKLKWAKKTKLITAAQVVTINKLVCDEDGNEHQCYDVGKLESALHSAFYPGDPPFNHGGIATVGGAITFYNTMAHAFFDGNKRTAVLAGTLFMKFNGWVLLYPPDSLADLIEECASGKKSIEELKGWFDDHKVRIGWKSYLIEPSSELLVC
jgi:death on curing protein